jgi:hypothetical protein
MALRVDATVAGLRERAGNDALGDLDGAQGFGDLGAIPRDFFGGPEPRGVVEGAQQFLASVNRLATIPDVSAGLLVHSWLAMSTYPNGGTFERAARLQLRRGNDPNPFVDPGSWRAWTEHLKMVATKFMADEKAKAATPTAAR